jgi:hypothetical protein
MGRVVGILLLVIAIWLGLQAILGEEPPGDPEQAAVGLLQRTEDTLRRDFESGHERREALLPE